MRSAFLPMIAMLLAPTGACGSRATLGEAANQGNSAGDSRRGGALEPPPTSSATSCDDIHQKTPSAPTGVYTVVMQGRSVAVFCEMNLAGGGFTAFFSGSSGHDNVFAHFESTIVFCTDPAQKCLRRLPPEIDQNHLFMATCGDDAITFRVNTFGLALFNHGGQSKWQPLSHVTAVRGAPVLAYAT
jgi:hypothetical protein